MPTHSLSIKGEALIEMYKGIAQEGHDRIGDERVKHPFSYFNLRKMKTLAKKIFRENNVSTVLDYGSGAADWEKKGFDEETNLSAIEYFELEKVYLYEPGREIDERQKVDCVVCIDVLEHIFICDIPILIRDMLSYSSRLALLNIACYPAQALLPNGDNAHVTVRSPFWWKGVIDSICIEFPSVNIFLGCTLNRTSGKLFNIWKADCWQESDSFVVDL